MQTLTVKNFSCIKSASMEVERLTLIIGPQASGKSLLSKLVFFLLDALHLQYNALSRKENFDRYSAGVKARFLEWFPTQAWGDGKFHIELSAGNYNIALTRKSWKEQQKNDFRIKFSDEFKLQYETLLAQVVKVDRRDHDDISAGFEFDYQFREAVDKSTEALMGKDAIARQAFIPAGRSFFTSIGKAIAAFEQGRVLDPLILRFGRMYTVYKERPNRFNSRSADIGSIRSAQAIFKTLLGGTLKQDGDVEFVEMEDGRRVPLSAMSSGQQELLPLMAVLPWLFGGRKNDKLCYIEEPEAHLFPDSQGRLVEALVVAANAGSTNLVLTTHSPYVVTKLNNLLKAGAISRKLDETGRKQMDALVSRRSWLQARNVRAYALHEGVLRSILDETGLVDADYLDSASCALSDEFSGLLDLEERYV